jgi:type IV pilus assembly protein PilV
MKSNRGFTLIEILVTVLIIATALLGLVGLQAAGVKNTVTSYNRTQASHLAYSMADRMRANVAEAAKGASSAYLGTPPSTPNTNCLAVTGCSSADIAGNDLYEWHKALKDTKNGLTKVATINVADCKATDGTPCVPYPFVFTIAICWENVDATTTDCTNDPNTFRTDFQL